MASALEQVAKGVLEGSDNVTATSSNVTTYMMSYTGLIPTTSADVTVNNIIQPRYLPLCHSIKDYPLVFTQCQDRYSLK